jgi:tetratricopeptide (TPR) repeat protein
MDYNASGPWADQLMASPDWRLIYLDSCAALFAAKDYATQLPAVDFSNLASTLGIPLFPENEISVLVSQWSPAPLEKWISGFYQPQTYPLGLSGLGLFSMKYGQYAVARSLFLNCLQQAGGGYEEIYYNLAVSSLHLGDFSLARLCLQDSLHLNPENTEARRMLKHFSS